MEQETFPQPDPGTESMQPQVPWRLRDLGLAAASVLAAAVFTLIVLGIVFRFLGDIGSDGEMAAALAATLVIEAAFLAAAAWFGIRKYSCGWQALGFRAPAKDGWWMAPVVVVAAYIVLGAYLNIVHAAGIDRLRPESTPRDIFDNPAILPLTAVLVLMAAPIAEETFFRGFIFPGLRRRWGLLPAALASGALFALAHFNLGSIIPFTAIGAFLAIAYALSGSLWPGILAHFSFNLISFVATLATRGGS